MICVKRAYDPPDPDDGTRILVDRLWPRGIKKEDLRISSWLKEVAPSDELRRWFGHDPAKWDGFVRRYSAELDAKPDVVRLLSREAKSGDVTLLYGAHDAEHNNAVALRDYLEGRRPM